MNVAVAVGDNPLAEGEGVFNAPALAIDTETTGLTFLDTVTMISLAWRSPAGDLKGCCLIPETWQEPAPLGSAKITGFDTLLQDMMQGRRVVFHNLPFDFRMLWHLLKIKPTQNMHDTMQLAKQVNWFDSLSLGDLYQQLVGPAPDWIMDVKEHRKTFLRIPLDVRAKYSRWDAISTLELYEKLREMAPAVIPAGLYRRDLRFSELVMRMMMQGIKVNPTFCEQGIERFQLRMGELAYKFMGYGITNINSDEQIRNWLFSERGLNADYLPRTGTGKISVAAEVLDTLVEAYPEMLELGEIVEYRQLGKCVNNWLTEFLSLSQEDGRIHSELHPFGTRSFRMTAKEPNMLALPMEDRGRAFGSLLGMFVADDPESELWAIDLKQAEVRLGAMLAQEDRLAEVFNAGGDPYEQMALAMWGQTDKTLRRQAKAAVLAGLYEIGPTTFSQKHKLPIEESRRVLDDFRHRFPNIREASRFYMGFAQENGYSPLHDGRRRYFPKDGPFYPAFNQRIQGGVAEIMQAIMLNVDAEYPGRLLLQIHDAIVLQVPKHEGKRNEIFTRVQEITDAAVPEALYKMTSPVIPFKAEAKPWQ